MSRDMAGAELRTLIDDLVGKLAPDSQVEAVVETVVGGARGAGAEPTRRAGADSDSPAAIPAPFPRENGSASSFALRCSEA